jgi:HEAT repeat protein
LSTDFEKDICNLGSQDEYSSLKAQQSLVRAGSKAIEPLIEATFHSDFQVRCRAVWALGKIGDSRAFQAILRLVSDPDEDVCYDAMMALGDIGDERAVEPLIRLLRNAGTQENLASSAATALIRFKKSAIEPLKEVLRDGDSDARWLVAQALGGMGLRDSISPLADLLDDEAEHVRIAAIESLAQLGESQPKRMGRRCLELLEKGLDDAAPAVRKIALFWSRNLRVILDAAQGER